MRYLIIACGLSMGVIPCMASAQERDEDDPFRYEWRDNDYQESGRHFGTPFYPRYEFHNSPVPRRYDNRDYAQRAYPSGSRTNRYARNYGLPSRDRQFYGLNRSSRYDDPDPFDAAYSEPRGDHYIAPDAENFRGGRYATDYPGFRGGWYGRDHHIRMRAGRYTAGDFANAFLDHQHRARSFPGQHNWNWNSGQAY
jgi:hypothetical protein